MHTMLTSLTVIIDIYGFYGLMMLDNMYSVFFLEITRTVLVRVYTETVLMIKPGYWGAAPIWRKTDRNLVNFYFI